ncbi:uncharacterized protein LOC105767596 [Gossypium raimondii]|uniref:Uncharacterized protein n=1 Tax=Gossypium raimondii TaxID=29730 RepID=A0A0D2TNE3_GOSRA|nr:uncharacterized protein LOC105767596 [Gossypium raimondii]KJB56266.1 hypothetical protein B456_009G113600 [Gossypium raimondii]MBA0594730.1 hypothetical protein [Gossypium raimondii]
MGNSIRCCLGCVLPCGALDLIRIVHLNGYVEEITHPVTAGDILKANPNHVLSKPCSHGQAVVREIVILSPESKLRRGCIYFLIPQKKKSAIHHNNVGNCNNNDVSDCHPSNLPNVDISKKKHSSRKDRRHLHSHIGVWRPHLAIISED